MKKTLCILLAFLMLMPVFVSCKGGDDPDGPDTSAPEADTSVTAPQDDDPFSGCNFKGENFDIYSSTNLATISMSSSNNFIEGPEEVTGDAALDSVLKRNNDVSELLNVNLVFEEVDYNYLDVASNIRQLILSGDDTYELMINDMYGLVPITVEGLFRNTLNEPNFDFTADWWYDEFMNDVSLNSNMRFALAGDFFIDQLRCTHCLVMNKDIYTDLCGDPNQLYQDVIDRKWTIDRYTEITELAHIDKNGNGERDDDDQYGAVAFEVWGSLIPWVISGDPGFIERDDEGYPVITVDNEKSYTLLEKLNFIFNSPANYIEIETDEQNCINLFTSGLSLFLWYQRLASLESNALRATDVDLAVLPYPLRDETQKDYVTSTHDTAELGFIPVSVSESAMPFVSTVIEVLCRETNRKVLPVYYESSLKIKYTRDSMSGQMIDIIHDHYGNGFPLVWSSALSYVFAQNTFCSCIRANDTNFASTYKKIAKTANRQLANCIKKSEDVIYDQEQQAKEAGN